MPNRKVPTWTPCGYCFERWATVWDHLQPWSKRGLSIASNLYPSCVRCNGLLRDLSFNSIQEKREYVRTELIERGEWHPALEDHPSVSDLPGAVREEAETSEVLQSSMSETGMVRGQEEHGQVPDMPRRVRKAATASGVLQSEVPVAGVAKSKSRKPAVKDRTCRACLDRFTPRRKNQLFCDKVCQESVGRGHDRLEKRLRELIRIEHEKVQQYITDEVSRQLAVLLEDAFPIKG